MLRFPFISTEKILQQKSDIYLCNINFRIKGYKKGLEMGRVGKYSAILIDYLVF